MPSNPCDPIAKQYPAGEESASVLACIDAAYATYTADLALCGGSPDCCIGILHNYLAAWQTCTGTPHPDVP